MSDASMPHCQVCGYPEYACACTVEAFLPISSTNTDPTRCERCGERWQITLWDEIAVNWVVEVHCGSQEHISGWWCITPPVLPS